MTKLRARYTLNTENHNPKLALNPETTLNPKLHVGVFETSGP